MEKIGKIIESSFIRSSCHNANRNHRVSVETMLRIYFLQRRYQMSAQNIEEALLKLKH